MENSENTNESLVWSFASLLMEGDIICNPYNKGERVEVKTVSYLEDDTVILVNGEISFSKYDRVQLVVETSEEFPNNGMINIIRTNLTDNP